jgi:hypothetical protein
MAWVPVRSFVKASGWCDVVAAAGVTVDLDVQAEAEAETLRRSGVTVLSWVDNADPEVRAWARALDEAVAKARQAIDAGAMT